MNQPTVAAIMLVNGRELMVRRAIKSFHSQTYENKLLFCLDTGEEEIHIIMNACGVYSEYAPGLRIDRYSVGKLRNVANGFAEPMKAEIIVHWDSDDLSHPNRITEQVALLQSSGKQAVGYRNMLFWRTLQLTEKDVYGPEGSDDPCDVAEESWLYSNPQQSYCLGTSLCYWREVWERRPFPDLPKAKGGTGEDVAWLQGVDSLGIGYLPTVSTRVVDSEPRIIASIHGSNTQYYGPDLLEQSTSWRRAPEWDKYCRDRMAL